MSDIPSHIKKSRNMFTATYRGKSDLLVLILIASFIVGALEGLPSFGTMLVASGVCAVILSTVGIIVHVMVHR